MTEIKTLIATGLCQHCATVFWHFFSQRVFQDVVKFVVGTQNHRTGDAEWRVIAVVTARYECADIRRWGGSRQGPSPQRFLRVPRSSRNSWFGCARTRRLS